MSNNQTIGVSRELAKRILSRLDTAASAFKAAKVERNELRALLDAPLCKTCNGTQVVDDGELHCSEGGIPFENGPIKCVRDCPDCKPAPVAVVPGLTWWAQGDANFYTLHKDGNWYAVIQMNGELWLADQEAFLNGICPQHGTVADGKARDV